MIIFSSIHIAANGIVSFFFMAEKYSIVYIYHIFFIHSSIDGHLMCVCVCVCELKLILILIFLVGPNMLSN